jgi:hypothetical protein
MAGRDLDDSSAAYVQIKALIEAAHRAVGANHPWWNRTIKQQGMRDKGRSQTDLDGTIRLHKDVIKALGQGVGRDPQAAREAAYRVVYEALRTAGPHDPTLPPRPNEALDKALPANQGQLDRALAAQRAEEITEPVMAAAGMGEAYLATPLERTDAGRGRPADQVRANRFSPDAELATARAAARGLVDRLAEASDKPREQARARAFDALITSPKPDRWIIAVGTLAEDARPRLLDRPEAAEVDLGDAHRAANQQWARVGSARPVVPGRSDTAEEVAYQVGRDTGGVLVQAAKAVVRSIPGGSAPEPQRVEAAPPPRELTPAELLGAQTPPDNRPAGTAPVSGSAHSPSSGKSPTQHGLT